MSDDASVIFAIGTASVRIEGTQAGDPAIRFERAPRVVVTALRGGLPAHADGETLCVGGQQLTLELLPARLEVVCPAPKAAAE